MKFEKLEKGTIAEVEKKYLDFWERENIFQKSIDLKPKNEKYVFFDGPATANGHPGLHHMLAKFLKDSFCKYETMKGCRVVRKVGWDTHGLPVELQVEKELGFSGKKDIESYGIEAFNKKCRESVWKNEKSFSDLTRKMGQFIDLEHPYVTYDNDYIETEWWILKKFFEEGYFYEGSKILPYCPRCGTGLASHEVAQGYKDVDTNTVIVPMKKKGEDVYFLVWTTTPWTLISNVGLCVNPTAEYVRVRSQDHEFILAKSLVSQVLGEDVQIMESYLGSDLEYMEYEQLIPELKVEGRAFFVTMDEYVTMEDGTGIVHLAPAFGEDDNRVGTKYKLPYVNPVGEDGKYLDGPWKGQFVFDADLEVIKYLKEHDKLFKKQKIKHNYPHCWRCSTPLIYYAKPSFYLATTQFKDKIIAANKEVCWHPAYVGEKRFGNWLENLKDWAISRNRYWGTPLPLWRCECGHDLMIGSRKELVEKALEEIDESIELHRPYVDDIHIACPECGHTMKRVEDVIDCWFDSGSMPFAQYHYPFENEDIFEDQFPADFICEGIDQTRGWFYTLLVISTFLKGCAPYKNVLVNDLVQDAEGKKMSKSKGNIVEPFTTMEKYGADTVRFYLAYVSPVWTPLKFDEEGLKEIYSKFTSTLKNTYAFFEMYANADDIDPRAYHIPVEKREFSDQFILSKLNRLILDVTHDYEEYDLNKVARAIVPFLNDDLSNWYIRSNRRRFWDSELNDSKKAVYLTLYEVLVALVKLVAPITPYLTEEIYQKLTGEESIHLADFPVACSSFINDVIEERMDLVRDICSLGRFAREEAKIKVRQPIQKLLLSSTDQEKIGDLLPIIMEELNVKEVVFQDDMSMYLDYIVKPNFKVLGKTLGPKIKELQQKLQTLSKEEIVKLQSDQLEVELSSSKLLLTKDMVVISLKQKAGYASSSNDKTCVVLDTTLTEELILEGLAREFMRNVQALRKEADFNIVDHIHIYYDGDEKISQMLEQYEAYIKEETLAVDILKKELDCEEIALNDIKGKIQVERI